MLKLTNVKIKLNVNVYVCVYVCACVYNKFNNLQILNYIIQFYNLKFIN